MDKYPAVRDYLIGFGKKRLEQSGKPGARKKTSHKWFETQDPIAYWEDFSKQKIVYREISSEMNACFATEGMFINNKSYMITGEMLKYLLGILNSFLFNHIILQSVNITGGKGADFLQQISVPYPKEANILATLVSKRLNSVSSKELNNIDREIDIEVYHLYLLNSEEVKYLATKSRKKNA
jgi:hypothetical protein